MPRKKLPDWRENDLISAKRLNEMQRILHRVDNRTARGMQFDAVSAEPLPPPTILKVVRLDELIGAESSSDFRNRSGTVQFYNHSTGQWQDSDETLANITDAYGLIYDDDERVLVLEHWSGKAVPINGRTVRHAITCADDDGYYPTADENPDTYPIKFVRLEYDEAAGFQGHTLEYLQPEDDGPDDFVHNIAEVADGTGYIPECTLIQVYHVTDQWFTFVYAGDFEGCSSSSSHGSSHSSESSSQGSSLSSSASSLSSSSASSLSSSSTSSLSSSSASSLSSSSQSSSNSSSDDSSSNVSSGSSSQGSSASSSGGSSASSGGSSASSGGSSTSSDLSSGGSSASSDLSSGGSSASSDESSGGSSASSVNSSGGSSASSQPSSECTETETFVTSLAFDEDSCVLTYCTKSLTWPCDLGITVGAENC